MDKMRQWTVLTAVGVVVVLAAGWFLLVSPQKSKAADLKSQTATQQSANATLQAQVAQLEQQKKGLPAQQRLLDQIATKIPGTPELPTLIRQLSTAAKGAGVDLVSLAPAPPAMVTPVAPAVPAPAPASTTASSGSTSTGSTSTAAAPAAPAAPATSPLAQIAVSINVTGSYFNITSFFHALEQLRRSMLVTQFSLAPGGAGKGAQAAAPDALTGTISAVVFESPEAATAPAAVTPVAPAPQTSAAPAAAK